MSSTINMDRLPANWEKMMLDRADGALAQPRPVSLPDELREAPQPRADSTMEPEIALDFDQDDSMKWDENRPDSALAKPDQKSRRSYNIRRGAGALALFAIAGLGTTVIAASADPNSTLGSLAAAATGSSSPAEATPELAGLPPLPDTESLVLPPITPEMEQAGALQPAIDPASFSAEAPNSPAARPFNMASASAIDRARAVQCLATAIYYEAASEPLVGKQAVAQVVLNRVMHPAFPNTVCGVVYQGSERWTGCQFSFTCDGAMARRPMQVYWDESSRVAQQALSGFVYTPVGWATHYHTWKIWPYWGKTLVSTASVGAHIFHRWRGFWGTPQAFRSSYRGGEPVPGPHARVGPPPAAPAQTPVAAGPAANVPMPGQAIPQSSAAPVKTQDFGAVPMPSATVQAQAPAYRPAPPPPPMATVDGARGNLGKRNGAPAAPPRSQVNSELQQSGTWIGEPPR